MQWQNCWPVGRKRSQSSHGSAHFSLRSVCSIAAIRASAIGSRGPDRLSTVNDRLSGIRLLGSKFRVRCSTFKVRRLPRPPSIHQSSASEFPPGLQRLPKRLVTAFVTASTSIIPRICRVCYGVTAPTTRKGGARCRPPINTKLPFRVPASRPLPGLHQARGESPKDVAQILNLPYRRFATC
jgi:hypothetical protein